MADNAVYDVNAPGTVNPALEQQRADMQRQDLLATQGTMIAPAPMQMTPAEQSLSVQKQNGVYNPYGPMDRAAINDEDSLANQAFPDLASEQAISQPQPGVDDLQWLDGQQTNINAKTASNAANSMYAPFYQKMAAQNDLRDATQTMEKTRQENLEQKAAMEQDSATKFNEFKKKYDVNVQQKMMETDAALKQVEEDALNARKGTADLFAEKSTGQKIAAGIAMVLGVAHSGLTGNSGNIGVDVVTNALENDRKHNLANFANSKEMLNLKTKNLDDYNDALFKQMQVADRQKMLQLQVISTKLSQAESVYRGSAAGAAAKSGNADIQVMLNQMKQQNASQEALQATLSSINQSGKLPTPIQTLGLPKEWRTAIEDQRGLTVDGYNGVAANKEDRDAFNKVRQSQEPAINGLQRILELQKTGSRLNMTDRAKMASEINATIGNLREAIVGPGAMTEAEFERIRQTIGDGNKLFSLPTWERAKTVTAIQKLKGDLNIIAKLRGFRPPQEFQSKSFSGSDAKAVEAKYSKFLK